jgi:flagellar M-ring protein FliF
VAVLVDGSEGEGDEFAAEAAEPSLRAEDVERYTALVKEAVGFDATRGDTVVVMNAAFRDMPEIADVAEPKIWEKPLVRDVLKQVLGAVLVLALAFGLVRPLLKNLVGSAPAGSAAYPAAGRPALAGGGPHAGQQALTGPGYDEKVRAARNIVGHDPARVAQLVRKWATAND